MKRIVKAPAGHRKSGFLWSFALHIFFVVFCILIVFPFYSVFIQSIDDAMYEPLRLLPGKFTVESYKTVLAQKNVLTAFFNSVFRTLVGMSIATTVTFCGAYALSKKQIPFNRLMTGYVIIPMFFGGGLIPLYLQMMNLRLIDNRWALILPMAFSGFNALVTRNFIYSIPVEMEESALLDGANEARIAFQIYLPLSLPIIATIALWTAVAHWNAWFDAMIYIRTPSKQVLQALLRRVLLETQLSEMYDFSSYTPPVSSRSMQAALLFISTLPILMVYPFAQKYFIRGLTAGAVKG
jgi:putative aldouronate transport system permease protein